MLANALPQFRQVASKICVNLGDFVAMTTFLVGLRPLAVELGPMSMALKWVGVVNFFLMGISVIRSIGSVTVIWIEDMSQMSVCKVFCGGSTITSLRAKGIIFIVFLFVSSFGRKLR